MPTARFEVVHETVHHRDEMERCVGEVVGEIVPESSLDLVGALSEPFDTEEPASPEG